MSFFNFLNIKKNLIKNSLIFCKIIKPSTPSLNISFYTTTITSINNKFINLNTIKSHFNYMCNNDNLSNFNNSSLIFKRFYRPDRNIDWVGIKTRWRTKQIIQKKKKHKNHPRVAMRFKLTRFGWERLQSGRNAPKLNMTRLKYRNKMRVKYASRSDLKKLTRQMPGFRLRGPNLLTGFRLGLNTNTLNYKKSKLVDLPTEVVYNTILDIPNYHKFVPWCKESNWITDEFTEDSLKKHRDALLTVNFLLYKESYISKVSFEPYRYIKAIASDSKLFETLDTTWELIGKDNKTLIDFSICYKFRNPIYQHLSNTFNNTIAKTMLAQFIRECKLRQQLLKLKS